jgi:hypothetical protein
MKPILKDKNKRQKKLSHLETNEHGDTTKTPEVTLAISKVKNRIKAEFQKLLGLLLNLL